MAKENHKITLVLRKVNLLTMMALTVLILCSFFVAFENSWKYLPIFKYHLFKMDRDLSIFVHAYMFGVNLGFFFQLFVLTFSFMIFFSIKRSVAFHLLYSVLILRSVLILIQANIQTAQYISPSNNNSAEIIQCIYILFFTALFILNTLYDSKKNPRVREPFELEKD